jgi:quinol monooxygenase YgiN
MSDYTVTVIFKAKPEKINTMKQVIDGVYAKSLKESGVIEYRWYQSHLEPAHFLLFMTWENEAAFKTHVASEHVEKAECDLKELLEEPAPELSWHFCDPQLNLAD